jgi:hypothetical protein
MFVSAGTPPSEPHSESQAVSLSGTDPGLAGSQVIATGGVEDVQGTWELSNEIDSASYAPYRGLRLGYRLQLQQAGRRISGQGEKWTENGRQIPPANRTPISVAGTIEGRHVALTFRERGSRRSSGGRFELELVDDAVLRGNFESDVARAHGRSVAQRVSTTLPSAKHE